MRVSDDLQLLPVTAARGPQSSEPRIRIRMYKGISLIAIPQDTLQAAGWGAGRSKDRSFVQVFVSANAIQLRGCNAKDQAARLIATGGDIRVPELAAAWRLVADDKFVIPVDVLKAEGARLGSLIGTVPAELRERITQGWTS